MIASTSTSMFIIHVVVLLLTSGDPSPGRITVRESDDAELHAACLPRRTLLVDVATIATATLSLGTSAHAKDDAKGDGSTAVGTLPYAKTEALLPAVRVKLWIDKVLELTKELLQQQQTTSKADTSTQQDAIQQQLDALLMQPQNFGTNGVNPIPNQPGKPYLDAYRTGRSQLNLLARPGAALVQNGEINAWKRLKRQEQQREKDDELRAAFNTYTTSLNFAADKYVLNVDSSTRSQMIRSESLPDVKQVIASDMGLRYLYRNQVLSAVADAKAEWEYQQRQEQPQPRDYTELIALLEQAQTACNKWFSLIDAKDVQDAMDNAAAY
ncbi:expressed unknown protein [Seminavis robusta]|uniref:Secreted protein n=1 Tax=Seminavis robusta TaxID=568900 RepID=A0A9N8EG31_9STRA|nr:expressed unknown protein [Seminavis robusta]|eukprot:Sro1072_g238040.1 n/a (326) ;mRNA; f:8417-9394